MISVTIDPKRFDNPVHQGMHTLAELRQAGVPVVGTLFPVCVEWGILTISGPDLVDGTVTLSWSEN